PPDVETQHFGTSSSRFKQAKQQAYGCRFTSTIRAKKPENSAGEARSWLDSDNP
ncbi:unnamed protein product, partial [marine sediment metagenome]